MAAELLKGPDPAMIYQYGPDPVRIDYPELILRLLMVPLHLSGLSMLLKEPPGAVCPSQAIYLHLQNSTAQHSTAQHSTAQHSTAQHSTAQHSTAQHSMVS